jgi:hypothetical protein
VAGIFSIRRNPSVHQIEALNASISAVPEDDPIVLLLARRTDAKFFSDEDLGCGENVIVAEIILQ